MLAPFALPLFVLLGPALASFREDCLALTPQSTVANSTGRELAFVTSGTDLAFPEQDAACNRASQVVRADLCRVAMNLTTSARSEVVTEVWLPEKWNGRLVTVAGGGSMAVRDLTAKGLMDKARLTMESQVFTTRIWPVGTNNGHAGTTGIQFLNNEDVVIDFSWRACVSPIHTPRWSKFPRADWVFRLHVGVVAGKQLLQSMYKRPATGSYFLGCSLGGRQGIKAADMFPEDFDGVVAGAPAIDFNNLYSHRAGYLPQTGAADSKDFIAPAVWKTTIHSEVLRQCDAIDGAEDGIIEDPALCNFDPGALLCRNNATADGTGCLSSKQVEIVRGIFAPTKDAQGNVFWPGMNPGSEINTADGLYSGKPWANSQNWFRYALEKDGVFAEQKNPGDIRTHPSDLSAFKNRGGKLLMYHGQQDHQITSFRTPMFYDRVSRGMGLGTAGMDHLPFYGTHNVLAAIVDWVEGGVAPDTITGTKFVNDTVALGVDFQRRHCRYPRRNVFKGDGFDPKNADSWKCTCS
ncbi:carboxylic ester hydrolase [Colletotrichum higginsianum]|nr:carboxylic ester hydrolase [Colletotrichum higginsianum]